MRNCFINSRKVGLNFLLIFVCVLYLNKANCQTQDSIAHNEKKYKNVVRFNLTNWLIYDNSFQFSYERLLKRKNQTISVFGGYQEFPLNININIDRLSVSKTKDKSGYTFGVDYRFYLTKENKYDAPHGVYLAPYASFLHFQTDRMLNYENSGVIESTNLNTQINIVNIGGTLGYQFVINKRFVIDAIVFGPAVSSYQFKARLNNDLEGLDSNEVAVKVIEGLKEKFPLLKDLSGEKTVSQSGTQAFWSGGFRYSISVGYRF